VGLSFNIPFYVVKMEKIFGDKVIDRFISDYQNGMTPNPCVECNTFVKFGALFEKAKALGIDKIATGHYAKIHQTDDGHYAIANGVDTKKNQAYYLYGLSQENLKNTVFPLGDMEKSEVREHARRFGLSIAEKAESQEICFIPENDYRSFLKKKNINFTPGFFKLANGVIVGKHSGKEGFTIGQRKGLGVSWKTPLYVVSIEDDGTVILGEEEETTCEEFTVIDLNYQGIYPLQEGKSLECKVQIRYRHKPVLCEITNTNGKILVRPKELLQSVTPGQSSIFYPVNGDYLLLGGIIEKGSIKLRTKNFFATESEGVGVSK
jgi:tRNA-specific 2-thiouridylase